MVFEGVVSSLLNKYLGEFVENLDSSQLSISIFSGRVELNNLRLKASALDSYGLPFKVKSGLLGKLFLNIPWQSLYTSATEVVVENLFIDAYLDTDISADTRETLKQRLKMTNLENMESMLSLKLLSTASSKAETQSNSKEKPQSYVEKIGALIVRNLLVTLKNINIVFEQNESDELFKPFYYGIHLKSLTAQTTDPHYRPCFSNEVTPLIYKLIKLDSTSMYWLPEKCQFDYNNINESISKLSKLDYILRLDDIYLKACLNTDPSYNYKIPSLGLILHLQTISVAFNAEMFISTINMINHYTNTQLKVLYSQYKPVHPLKNKARTYWEYAINVILNQYVRPKTRTWNWAYIKSYRQKARDYQNLYLKYLRKDADFAPSILESYEKTLNLMTLFLCRHMARLTLKKDMSVVSEAAKAEKQQAATTSSSWFGRFFGRAQPKYSPTTASNVDSSMEAYLGLTEEQQQEQLNKLLDVVGHEVVDESKLPPEFVKLSLAVILDEFEWIIKKNRVDSLLVCKLKTLSTNFLVYANKPGSVRFSTTVFDMNISAVRKCGFQFDFFKIIEPNNELLYEENSKSPLVNMIYSAYPPNLPDVDHKFNMVTKKSQVNIDLIFVNECVDIVNSLPTIDQWEVFSVGGGRNPRPPSSDPSHYDHDTHRHSLAKQGAERYDISVDACVSAVHICDDFVVENNEIIVLNLGYVCLLPKPSDSISKCNQLVENEDLMNQRKHMQQFDFSLTNVSIRVIENSLDSSSQHHNLTNNVELEDRPAAGGSRIIHRDRSTNYILAPFTIESEISTALTTTNSSDQIPQLLVLSLVSRTSVMLSTPKIVAIHKLVDRVLSILPKIKSNSSTENLDDKLEVLETIDVDDNNIFMGYYNNTPTSLDDFLSIQTNTSTTSSVNNNSPHSRRLASSRSELSLDSKKSLTSNRRSIEMHVVAPDLGVTFVYDDYQNQPSDVTFSFSGNAIEFIGQTLDYSFNLSTHKAIIEHNSVSNSSIIFNVDDGLLLNYCYCLLPSIVKQAHDNGDITEKQLKKAESVFEEFYDSTEHNVSVRWGTLNFVCCYEVIQSIRSGFKSLAKSLKNKPLINHGDKNNKTDPTKSSSNVAEFTLPDLSSVVAAQVCDLVGVNETTSNLKFSKKTATINIHVESVSLVLSYAHHDISHIVFKQWFCDACLFANSDTQVNCILDDLSVWDLSYEETKFKQIVSVEGGKLFNLKFLLDYEKFQNSVPPAAVVDLKVAQLTLVFIYRFINNIIEWSNCLVQKNNLISATEQAISDITNIAKKQVAVKHTFVQLNVDIGAPIFVIPFKSNKPCVVIADFGHVYIHNTFVNDSSDVNVILCDKYTIDLEQINISRAMYDRLASTKQNILDPLDISLTLVRHLNDTSLRISVSIVNELINFALSPQDFLALVRLFVENFGELSFLSTTTIPSSSLETGASSTALPATTNDRSGPGNGDRINLLTDDNPYLPQQQITLPISTNNNNKTSSTNRSKNDPILVSVDIIFNKVNVSLFNVGSATDTSDYSESVVVRRAESIFAKLNATDFKFNMDYNSDGNMMVIVELPQLTVFDMRPSTPEVRQRVIFSSSHVAAAEDDRVAGPIPSQVFVRYYQQPSGGCSVELKVNDITLFLNASYLKSLYDSYIVPLMAVSHSADHQIMSSHSSTNTGAQHTNTTNDNKECILLDDSQPSTLDMTDGGESIAVGNVSDFEVDDAEALDIADTAAAVATAKNHSSTLASSKISCCVDVKSSRVIICATDTTEHALFAQMIGNFAYEWIGAKTSMSVKVATLSLDCAKFSGCWRSNTNYCQALRLNNSFFSIDYDNSMITNAIIDVHSLLANLAPPTLMAIFSIKDTLIPRPVTTAADLHSSSFDVDKCDSASRPANEKVQRSADTLHPSYSIENLDFVQLWSPQPLESNCWYLREIPPEELVIGTTAWVRLADCSYRELILTQIVLNMLHFKSLDSLVTMVHPKEDTLAVLPSLSLRKPITHDIPLGSLVLVEMSKSVQNSEDIDSKALGEITHVQLLNNKILKIQVFLYTKDCRIWFSQDQIYLIPKQFIRPYPGIYSSLYVRCADGRYRMGSVRSIYRQNISFAISNDTYTKSFAFFTDTAAWAYPWKKVKSFVTSDASGFKRDQSLQFLINNVILVQSGANQLPERDPSLCAAASTTIYEPIFVVSVTNYPMALVRYVLTGQLLTIDISQCILVDKQRGTKFGLGSRWLVHTQENHLEEYILHKKAKQTLTFTRNNLLDHAKLFNVFQKNFFWIDSEVTEQSIDYNSDVYVAENPEYGIYTRGKIVKKSYWLNVPEYKIKLYDGRFLLRCPLRNIRQRLQRLPSLKSSARSHSTTLPYSLDTAGGDKYAETVPKLSIRVANMNFVIEGMINKKIVPLLHLGSSVYGSVFNINKQNYNAQLRLSAVAYYFNNKCGEWEPLIERIERDSVLHPWTCLFEYNSSGASPSDDYYEHAFNSSHMEMSSVAGGGGESSQRNQQKSAVLGDHSAQMTSASLNDEMSSQAANTTTNNSESCERYFALKSSQRLEFTVTNKTIETLQLANYIFSGENVLMDEYSFLRNNFVIVNSLGVDVQVTPNGFFTTANQNHVVQDTLELYPVHPYKFDQKLENYVLPQLSIHIPGFRPLESVSIISNNSFQLMLYPVVENRHQNRPILQRQPTNIFPSIVLDIKSEKGSKIIRLRSILKIHNMLNHSLSFHIYEDEKTAGHARSLVDPHAKSAPNELRLESNRADSCSFSQLNTNSYITLMPDFSSSCVRISLQKLIDHYKLTIPCLAMRFENGNDFYIMLKLEEDNEPRTTRSIVRIDKTPIRPLVLNVLPPIVVHNHIPFMVILSFVANFSFPITVSDVNSVYNIDLNQNNQTLYVKVCGYLSADWVGKIVLNKSNRNKCSNVQLLMQSNNDSAGDGGGQGKGTKSSALSSLKFSKSTEQLKLNLKFDIKFPCNIVINIYSPVYVINNCSVPIKLRISRLAESWVYEIPANNLFLVKYESKDYKACIKFGDSKWSKEFSLNAVGNRATLTCTNKSNSCEYKVSMKITTSDYYATKCIKLKPFYILQNNLDRHIDIIHSGVGGGDQVVSLEPGSTQFFWPTEKFPMPLSIRYNKEVVYKFYPQPDEAIVAKLIDKNINKFDTIVINTSQQDYSTKIMFSNYFEGCAPVLMINACAKNEIPVFFKQTGAAKAYPLLAGYRILYTWENFQNPLGLVCSFNSGFDNTFEINVKQSVYALVREGEFPIYYATFLDGLQRVCMFCDDLRYIWRAVQESSSNSTVTVVVDLVEGLGLSLVHLDCNTEVFYMSIASNVPYWQYLKSKSVQGTHQENWVMFSSSMSSLIENYYGYYAQAASAIAAADGGGAEEIASGGGIVSPRLSNENEVVKSSSTDSKNDDSHHHHFDSKTIQPAVEDLSKGLIALSNSKRVNFNELYLLDGRDKKRSIRRIKHSGLKATVVLSDSYELKQVDLSIFYLQIDNPSMSSNFPVVFSPTPTKESVDLSKSVQQHVIEFRMELRPPRIFGDKRIIHVDCCVLLVQEFNLCIDLGFVSKVMYFINSTTNAPPDNEPSSVESKHSLQCVGEESRRIQRKKSALSSTSLPNITAHTNNNLNIGGGVAPTEDINKQYSQTFFIFDGLHLSPMKIIVAFSTTATTDPNEKFNNESSFIVQTILSHIPFVDVCDIALRLSCFEMTSSNKLVSFSELQTQIIEHYTFQTLRQAFVLVLGLDVIGNPFNFVTELASGTKNLFYEPYMGSIQGPDQFAKGLEIGLRSFASGTFGNAAGVLSKVTNSLGTGLAILSFDSQHQLSRRSIKRVKPQNLQEGMTQGSKGFVRGIVSGISGIVTKPIEGAISEGAEGFFKGIGKGIAGAFVKPIGGVVDLASSTLAGIKGGIKGSSIVRVYRSERAFYASCVLQNYLVEDALGYSVYQRMLKSNPGEYGGFVKCTNLTTLFLLLTEWFIITLEVDNILDKYTIIRSYQVYNINNISCVNRVIRFDYSNRKHDIPIEFIFHTNEEATSFYKSILVVLSWL